MPRRVGANRDRTGKPKGPRYGARTCAGCRQRIKILKPWLPTRYGPVHPGCAVVR